jgi:prepilin-type N-terminal cleavage/methylation domain-containing protein
MIINLLQSNMNNRNRSSQEGFTIIELMIATAIFTVILLFATVIIINIGDLYGKGVTQSKIQTTTRDDMDQISQSLMFSTGEVISPVYNLTVENTQNQVTNATEQAYCFGEQQYTFIENAQINEKIVSDPLPHAYDTLYSIFHENSTGLNFNQNGTPDVCTPLSDLTQPFTGGSNLAGPHIEIHNFSVSSASPYTVDLNLAYGDDDLLNLSGPKASCSGGTGDQFCATSDLTETVVQRVTP